MEISLPSLTSEKGPDDVEFGKRLAEEWKRELNEIYHNHDHCPSDLLGCTDQEQFTLILQNSQSVCVKPRSVAHSQLENIKQELGFMMKMDVIEKHTIPSPCAQ